ncbi:MAG: hypothetical protein Q9191_008362 [Dirinaria sp. TL-2023a]
MGDCYVVPSMISRAPFRDSDETNPQGNERGVYLRRKPLKQSWNGKKRYLSKLARYPPIAHWAIEIRIPGSSSGLVWEIKPVAATNWELEYDFGHWEYSSPEHIIKASEKKLGTTTLTDKEIDKKAQYIVTRLRKSKLDITARAAHVQLKVLSKAFSKKSMMGQQFHEDRSSASYNAWFKNCHSFAIDMAYELCGQDFRKKWKLNFYFNLMPSAVALIGLQQVIKEPPGVVPAVRTCDLSGVYLGVGQATGLRQPADSQPTAIPQQNSTPLPI